LVGLGGGAYFAAQGPAQRVLFDSDNAPLPTSLSIDLTGSGMTVHFSATGQGFSIQRADTLGFAPAGFSGFRIYPNSVFAAALRVGFSQLLTGFASTRAAASLSSVLRTSPCHLPTGPSWAASRKVHPATSSLLIRRRRASRSVSIACAHRNPRPFPQPSTNPHL
jgi:hypothetical protein